MVACLTVIMTMMMMMMMMMMLAIIKLWFLCHNQKLSRAVIKRWGRGIPLASLIGKLKKNGTKRNP